MRSAGYSRGVLTYLEACARIAELAVTPRTERLPVAQAFGRVLAEAVAMDRDQPSFDRATMDGYALCLDGERDRFRVVGTVLAGQAHAGQLQPGEALRIMTGAPCPSGLTVVQIERTDGGESEVHVTEPLALVPGRNIAWRGEDSRAGDPVLAAGTRLGPATLSAAAMAGASEVLVYVPPRVGIVTTGDEVGGAGPAGIHDSNGPLLLAFAQGLGLPVVRNHVRDDGEALEAVLVQTAEVSDVVVTVGGVSMGTHDLVPGCAERAGFRQVFHKVAVQPGKPVLVSQHESGALLAGLPGNPVSVLATAHLFLAPMLGLFLGGWTPRWLDLPMATAKQHRGKRHLFLPASLGDGGVRPVDWNGSGDLLAAAGGDGLVELPVGADLQAGDLVRFLPFLAHGLGEHTLRAARNPGADCC
ncbi:MAG: molybdopterin molybdotransferase [Planctomycetota bacterium]|jgi:molybdopterin molybdotransferase